MNKALSIVLIYLLSTMPGSWVFAQYFQQKTEYTIQVSLDTRTHILRGVWELKYTNNSPDTLRVLYFNLYPNAYSSKTTAYARQQQRLGLTEFQFADFGEMGGIDSLDFRVDGIPVPWSLDKENPDIASLTLTTPLLPGKSISLKSPMRVRVPGAFSRMGHIQESYQMTQWYPKPAVYDANGWNIQPYLDQGEFYSEFGSFDVSITLPGQQIVAATGDLLSVDCMHMLDSLADAKNAPLAAFPSALPPRTWRYHAENVHDFAWFCDPRFAVRKKTISLDGKTIDCWAFFTTTERMLWEKATDYLADGIQFYSARIGTYPYPHMSAVQIPLGNGYGMEYPMITAINLTGSAKDLDDVLVHEAGHNWFQGSLGSNERTHPWMDEGINTFYEYAYLRQKYGTWSENLILYKPVHPQGISDEQKVMQFMTREHKLVAPDTDPEYESEFQNFFGSYFKPALAFDMLREYMGHSTFDAAMQKYYNEWKFRHPQPDNLKAILTSACNCSLEWLFQGLLKTPSLVDYKIQTFENNTITIENIGDIEAPIHVIAIKDSVEVFDEWLPGFQGVKSFVLNLPEADHLQIYRDVYTLDLTPSDNLLLIKETQTTRKKLRLRLFGGKSRAGEAYLNVLPIGGWNTTDKGMIGVAISNTYWPPGNLQWAIAPLYSSHTHDLVGAGDVRYNYFPKGTTNSWQFGIGGKSFHFLQDTHYGYFDRYVKVAPHVRYTFGEPSDAQTSEQYLQYRLIYVQQKYGQGLNFDEYLWQEKTRSYIVHELNYTRIRDKSFGNTRFTALIQAGDGFIRTTADIQRSMTYEKSGSQVLLHGFAGYLPYNKGPTANVNFTFNGIQNPGISSRDYLYDELLFSRTATSGLASQFVFARDAQLKTLYNGGISDTWMISAGIAIELPIPVPIRPYIDAAVVDDPFTESTRFSYSGGLALVVQKNVLEIYIPLLESSDIRNSLTYLDRDTIFRRISILVNLKPLHPFDFKGTFFS